MKRIVYMGNVDLRERKHYFSIASIFGGKETPAMDFAMQNKTIKKFLLFYSWESWRETKLIAQYGNDFPFYAHPSPVCWNQGLT